MYKDGFSCKAAEYERDALVQKSAAEVLLGLVNIRGSEDVLDLGCGPGHITRRIASITGGKVVGVDVSEGMIREASLKGSNPANVSFLERDVKELGFWGDYDVIYCNSTFQWFNNPETALSQCYSALRPGGRIGVQAPATSRYCPNFVTAIEKVQEDNDTARVFKSFKNPWFFLESAEEYSDFFKSCGFTVDYCRIDREETFYTAGQVYRIFSSGAENGYLGRESYSVPPDEKYFAEFRRLVWDSIMEQSDLNGMVCLQFNRVYLVARK